MDESLKYTPPIAGNCVRNCGRVAGGTPWLCYFCFKQITAAVAINSCSIDQRWELEDITRALRNRVQKLSRKAFKRH